MVSSFHAYQNKYKNPTYDVTMTSQSKAEPQNMAKTWPKWDNFTKTVPNIGISPGFWLTYQFLSACFRNLTNTINFTYYQAFTMRKVWESVVSEA